MAGPVSLVFYLDYLYGTTKGNITSGVSAFDSRTGPNNTEYYSGDTVPQEAITGTSTTAITGTLAFTPLKPGTVTFTWTGTTSGAAKSATDDGNGGFSGDSTAGSITYSNGVFSITYNTDGGVVASSMKATYRYDTEANDNIPQVDLQLTSSPVSALVRKLRARWSLEAAQNMNALHGLDSEAELVGIMAELIKLELDREVINDLYNFAQAGSVTWDKAVPAGISYTEHKLSLVDAFIQNSNQVYSATKRGQTNWIVCGVGVADVLESLPTFTAAPGSTGTQANSGVIKAGTLNNRWTVFKDPFLTSANWVMGYKGTSFLDSGYVYAPYIPMYTTPTIILDDFIGRKGIAEVSELPFSETCYKVAA